MSSVGESEDGAPDGSKASAAPAREAEPVPRRGRLAWTLRLGLFGGLLYLVAWPVPIQPVAWVAPAAVEWAPNERLAAVERLGEGATPGPEDVALDARGRAVVGLKDGRILRFPVGGGAPETLCETGGRPLGLHFDASGALYVADAKRGLLRWSESAGLEVLVTEAEGGTFGFTDDVDIAASGQVYFTDASQRFGIEDYTLDLLEHGTTGRLLRYDPQTRETEVLLGGLQFANGVAVAADQRSLVVVETGNYRVLRLWLAGPHAGETEVLIDNLPGFPDGISARPGGGFWVALASPRTAILDALAGSPFAREVVARLPKAAQPAAQRHAFVLGLDAEGKVEFDLQHAAPDSFSPVTSVQEHEGWIYLGSLSYDGFARFPLPAAPTK